nr:hypothetical protein [Tanacetum cinerariifolium]
QAALYVERVRINHGDGRAERPPHVGDPHLARPATATARLVAAQQRGADQRWRALGGGVVPGLVAGAHDPAA